VSDELAIETHGLAKTFGRRKAVAGIDLAVPRGGVYGFLGPNGSGKTTTIRMLLGLATIDAGDVRVLGAAIPTHVRSVLPRVGALVEGPAFYPFLDGRTNLNRLDAANRDAASSTRKARVNKALERVGLTHAASKRVRGYSLGMKQRLGIAAALLSPRELLVLDEPTNGLDPQGTREVRSLVRSLAADGTTVFVSSHLLSEVEQVCTHVGVMSNGNLVGQGTLDMLRALTSPRLRVETPDTRLALDVLSRIGLSDVRIEAVSLDVVSADSNGIATEAACAALVEAGVRVRGLNTENGSLEDSFVALTGEGFDVAG
jgi:ABC-2 type transport system ATP-binding protein